jgi:hypothetical protein
LASLNEFFFLDDSPNNRGFCFDLVRSGQCKVSDTLNKKCEYSHDLDSILDYITYMCTKKGNITSACRLVYCMKNSDSPLNKALNEPLGFQIVETVIKFLMMVRFTELKLISYYNISIYLFPL